jgi:hypothetical protein
MTMTMMLWFATIILMVLLSVWACLAGRGHARRCVGAEPLLDRGRQPPARVLQGGPPHGHGGGESVSATALEFKSLDWRIFFA